MSNAWCECCGWRGAHDAHDPECGLFQARAEIASLTAELSRAQDHARAGADALRSCGAQTQEIGGRLDAAGEEIARLAAELAAARAVPADVEAAIDDYEARVTSLVTSMTGRAADDATAADVARDHLRTAIARAISDATAARGTVGGLLAAGKERESRAWSEKGKAPPGSCPFCASRISMVQRDGYFIARCSHRGCGAVGPRMRSVSRAADLFCQPPRREAQGMSCGPIVASPPRPRCSCTHEAGDSRCNVHPTCSECGASTTRPVDGCEACRGPLPKGG